ncbi:MAG: hypothetical protein QOF53_265, partial [Nocardioidaceae bacterium]|nr:hypothetical protein [Nocardioidaceae bacterium]
MSGDVAVSVALDADPRNVGRARRVLREALSRGGAEHLVEPATLVLSEVVTNAFVHVGTAVGLQAWCTGEAVRVEVEDGGSQMPVRRHYAETAGTGRGLQLLDDLTDRWGTAPRTNGKVVWFEIGNPGAGPVGAPDDATVLRGNPVGEPNSPYEVTLRRVPLLMHVAWQEHAATLLREFLLHVLDDDEDILTKHAAASEAMSLLNDQLPSSGLSEHTDALMAAAIEPTVTAEEVVLHLPVAS